MKKNLLTLLLIFCSFSPILANSVTIGDVSTTGTRPLPIGTSSQNNNNSTSRVFASFSQQIYLASEINAIETGNKDITAITFYLQSGIGQAVNRNLQVWLMATEKDSFDIDPSSYQPHVIYQSVKENNITKYRPGTKVYAGTIDIGSSSSYTIEFNKNGNKFVWDCTKNLLLTVIDTTNEDISRKDVRHVITTSTDIVQHPRFLNHWEINEVTSGSSLDWINDADFYRTQQGDQWGGAASNSLKGQISSHKCINKVTFTYTSPQPPATPTGLTVSATTEGSVSLNWDEVSGATSYRVEYRADDEQWTYGGTPTSHSYELTGLAANTDYYVRVLASNAQGNSAYSSSVSFTTDALHIHDGITFSKWNSTTSMPLSGNYYLANDVTITDINQKNINSPLNLCLNGHTLSFTHTSSGILVAHTGTSMALYDDVGGGVVTSPNGTATIQVDNDCSLAIHRAKVANSGGPDKAISADGAVSIDLTDAASNDAYLAIAEGKLNVSVNMTRSFTSSQYNTICLPFTLYNIELQNVFGSGYDLEQFTGSNLNGDELVLNFTKVTTLEAGKPYLIKPAQDVVNPTFANVGINSNLYPKVDDGNISFIGTYSPTALQSDPNILFLGANNELFWPQAAGNIGGFRAYFMLKGDAQAATRARIVKQEDDATGVENVSANTGGSEKLMRNGELLIIRDGKTYNALGQIVK